MGRGKGGGSEGGGGGNQSYTIVCQLETFLCAKASAVCELLSSGGWGEGPIKLYRLTIRDFLVSTHRLLAN